MAVFNPAIKTCDGTDEGNLTLCKDLSYSDTDSENVALCRVYKYIKCDGWSNKTWAYKYIKCDGWSN